MAGEALVRNASDRAQVKHARRKERDRDDQFVASLRELMQSEASRLVMWELLNRLGVYRSIWTPNAEIHYRAGRQDFGHELMAWIIEAGEDLYVTMEREGRTRARREATETAAVQQPRAGNNGAESDG